MDEGKDHKALRRTAVLLVALAALAERAALHSAPVIWLVLWVLRPAEAAARTFLIRSAWDLGFGVEMLDDHEPTGSGQTASQAALRLAVILRDLAETLDELAALALTDAGPLTASPVADLPRRPPTDRGSAYANPLKSCRRSRVVTGGLARAPPSTVRRALIR